METLSTFLSSLLGKVVAGSAVAAASVAGVNAADVELPDLSDKPAEVTTDDEVELPAAAQSGQAAAEDKRQDGETAEEELEVETEVAETNGGEPNENAEFGQDVAGMAQEGRTGQDLAEYVRSNNPGAAQHEDAGAPEDAGERQDDAVRQDDEAPQGADAAEQDPPADAAGDHPADQAEQEPGAQADTARGTARP